MEDRSMWSALLAKEQHSKSGYPLPQAALSLEFQGKPCHRNLKGFSARLATICTKRGKQNRPEFPSLAKEGWRGSCEKIGIKRYSPPCITARRGGRAIQKISRSIRLSRGRGGFPMNPKGKPPRLRLLRWLRQIFFDDAATPPCGGARRGITPYHN